MDLSLLNDQQKEAALHEPGSPAAIIAGAGSGKTKVLTTRIGYLIDEKGVEARRICGITFTNKAAGEIKERLHLTDEHNCPRVGTIHSLALSAIRRAPKGFGLSDKVTPLDDYDQTQMIRRLIEGEKLEEQVNPYLLLEKIGYHRARGVGFAVDYTDEVAAKAAVAHGGYHRLAPEEVDLWSAYEKEKTANSVVDFDDMIHFVVRRGRTDERWLANLQRAFDFVLMDEAQDTNVIQWAFINLLLPPGNLNMLCVGDVSQSIYGFNGAEPEILLGYTKGWRDVIPKVYKLEENYRSVPEVVALANKVQLFMSDTIPLKMNSNRGDRGHRGRIMLRRAGTPRELAVSVAEDILNRKVDVSYKDIAVLLRAGSQVRDVETELVRNRIPYIIRGTMGLLQTEEVKDILSYLKIASNPLDFSALIRSVAVPKRGAGEVALKRLKGASEAFGGDLIATLDHERWPKLTRYLQIVHRLREMTHDPSSAIDYLISAIDYEGYMKTKYKKYPEKIEIKQANIQRLKEMIEALMAEREMTIDDVVFQLTMQDQKDTGTGGKVVISTIHASKGLEWHTVFLMGLYEGSIPHKWSQSDKEIEEERRLFYVGCTRAKDNLILGVPATVEYYNKGAQFVAPSRFLMELEICK
jgi:DNA helicase-2/ATP-dependent DNA helicase PcrA